MSTEELNKRVESSPALRRAREALLSEASFRAGASARFDPFTIIALISLVIQILQYCRKRRHPDKLALDIRNVKTLSRFRTRRLRQKLDALWEEHCDGGYADCRDNPLLAAAYEVAENATDDEINELLKLAAEQSE